MTLVTDWCCVVCSGGYVTLVTDWCCVVYSGGCVTGHRQVMCSV